MKKFIYFIKVKLRVWAKIYVRKVKGVFREQMQSTLSGTLSEYPAASPQKNRALI